MDKRKVEQELQKLDAYALHKNVRSKFKRRRVLFHFINEVQVVCTRWYISF